MSFAVWKTLPSLPFLHLSLPNSAVISHFQRRNHAGKVVVLMVFHDCLQVKWIQLETSVTIRRMLAFSRTVCQSSGQRKKEGSFSHLSLVVDLSLHLPQLHLEPDWFNLQSIAN